MSSSTRFRDFYSNVFLAEHRHPLNRTLHVAGTIAGLATAATALILGHYWLILLFPLVHAAPGLLGHRLFERNTAVGDLRFTRKDYSPLWFILANHRLTWELITRSGSLAVKGDQSRGPTGRSAADVAKRH